MKPYTSPRRIAAALLCLAMSACNAVLPETGKPTMTTKTSTPTQTHVQTMCLGRFLIDLPAGATRNGNGLYKYDFIKLAPPPAMDHAQFEASVHQEEDRLRATKHDSKPSFLLQTLSPGKDTHIHVTWKAEYSTSLLAVAGHRWVNGFQFAFRDEVADDKQEFGVSRASDLLTRLSPRTDADIPTEPGFCFNGGFVANDKWKVEEVLAGFDIPEHPDVYVNVHFFPLAKFRQDKPLLDRVDGVLQTVGRLATGVHVVRKGDRQIGTFKGQEYLVSAPNDSGQRAHMFSWETQGEATLEAPFITIEMTTGTRDDKGNPQPTKLTDAQALRLWDSIVSTFRVRPTSAPPVKVSEAPPPLTPLGELAATGRICPQTGWWQCTEEALPVKGGKKQFFHQGENMPRATLVGEPSMWQRVKGEAPEHRVATVWKLVEYKASEQMPVAITDAGDPKADQPASGAETTASTEPTIAAAEDAEPNDNGQAPPPKDA